MKGMDLLGKKVQDRVTKQEGVVSSISYDLYGCIQAIITPAVVKNKREESYWYDIKRLKVLSKRRVMQPPAYEDEEEIGAEDKPIPD